MTGHLDAARWAALQQQADPELLAHLEAGCDECDAFLATVSSPALEGQVDALLLGLNAREPSRDELAWARFKKRSAAPSAPRRAAAALIALAAVAVLTVSALRLRDAFDGSATGPGVKGGSATPTLLLRAGMQSGSTVRALDPGARVNGGTLVFHVDSNVAGPARLFVQRGSAAPVELEQLGVTGGPQELLRDGPGSLLGFTLDGEHGALTFWLVAADVPFTTQQALDAIAGARAGSAGTPDGEREGGAPALGVGKLEVDVLP